MPPSPPPGYDGEAQSRRTLHGAEFQKSTGRILHRLLEHSGLHVVQLPARKGRTNPFTAIVGDESAADELRDRLSLPLRRPCDQQRVDTFPDSDLVILTRGAGSHWRILAVISCKTTLRERHTQSCFWGLTFKTHTDISYFLVTQDAKGLGRKCIGGNETRRRLETCTSGVFLIDDRTSAAESALERQIDELIARARTNPRALTDPVFDIVPAPVDYCVAVQPFSQMLPTLKSLQIKWSGT